MGRKYIMALSGFFLAVFLLFHAAGNSFIFQGKAALNAYADLLHSSGPLVSVAEFFLLGIFSMHIVVGISLIVKNQEATGSRYRYAMKSSAGGMTWGSRTMPWTGLIILAFLLLHLYNVRFIEPAVPIADVVDQILTDPFYAFFYLLGITALTLHISHGFWSLLQTWGIHHPQYNILFRCGAFLLTILISMVFFGVVVVILQQ